MVMDPQQKSSKTLPTLFEVHKDQDFSCPNHPGQKENLQEERNISAIVIDKSTFKLNNIPTTDPAQLLSWWFSTGISKAGGLVCKKCKGQKKKKLPTALSKFSAEVSRLSFEGGKAPAHLYINVDVVPIADRAEQREFMGHLDWPFKLTVGNEEYTMWTSSGYKLCHLLTLLDPEKEFMEASIKKIHKDNPNVKENLPFVKMHEVLNISHYADEPNPNSSDPKFLNSGNELDTEAQQEGPLVVPTVKTKNPVRGLKIQIRAKKPAVEMVDKAPAVPNNIGRKKPLKTKNGSDYLKPLTDEDWDRIEAWGAAFFAAHWKAQEGNDDLKLKKS
ncbi:hypothetical protein PCASD_19210 [Puccinia coronata f. sp. avenae]|uniref:Uncharacterized protein n=1 Tax=Puccinia coronata f. sp. avenae TaxID=200324 RepID=A0A2N5UKE9_9BASI|nr:hypothetical protein PCASD_19210 [Puccinia coronata f. sp. avenae]